MRYIQHTEGQSANTLRIGKTAKPTISTGQVLVKVMAFGVNRADTLQRQGKYPAARGESPILGLEVAGVIESIAAETDRWQVGDKVFGLVAGGGYAEYVAVNAKHLMRLPESLCMVEGAAISEVFLTAYQSLFSLAKLQATETVLIHAGASGVGLAAIQLAKHAGANVVATSSSDGKLNICKQMGADLLINYQRQDFSQIFKSKQLYANVIIDFVGGDYLNRNLSVLALDGRIIYLAMLAGRYADPLDMAKLLSKRACIQGSTLRNRSDEYKSALTAKFEHKYLAAFSSRTLVANLDTCFLAQDIAKAHERLETNASQGKLIGVWDSQMLEQKRTEIS